MARETTKSICQYCFNFRCSWHIRFEPVNGWTATPTVIPTTKGKVIKSFAVKNCPQFVSRDGSFLSEGSKRITQQKLGELIGYCASHTSKMDHARLADLVRAKGFKLTIILDGNYQQYYIEKIKK